MQATGTAMHQALAHRGPDDNGIWQDADAPVLLAHRRLSIIDLSADGHQPMQSGTGRYVVVYNGEIYNYLELRLELEALGRTFKSRSDTEVMLTAFEQWGFEEGLKKLAGMFALALWDKQTKTLHFARDRFGKKPLYIGWAGTTLLFASELKAFFVHPDFTPNVSRESIALFMHYGYMCAPHSIYQNVWQLLPASSLSIPMADMRPGADLTHKMAPYWFLPDVVNENKSKIWTLSEQDLITEFEARLESNVDQRMISDVPLGAFLSGGIDSSTIVALMQKNSENKVKTFSIGFQEQAYNEAVYAKDIAAHLGTDHTEFYVTPQDALNVIPKLPDIYDEPFADSSQIPTYLISKLARDHVTVVLTGDGGDEILGGYQRHTHIPDLWSKIGWIPRPARYATSAIAGGLPAAFWDKLNPSYPQFGRRMKRLIHLIGLKDARAVYDYLMAAWPDTNALLPGTKLPSIPLTESSWQPSSLSFAEKMIYGDTLSYRPNDLMVKTDRASMAVALEARAPLMDHSLCELSWHLPMSMKIRGRTGKWILRQVLKKYVPDRLIDRPKMGFGVPVDDWLRGPLKGWAGDLLSEQRLKSQGIFDAKTVAKAWETHQKGQTEYGGAPHIWALLMFQAWHDRWMKS